MTILILPVANGVLPRPENGRISGMFVQDQGGQLLAELGVGQDILACPWIGEENTLYQIGVICRILEMAEQSVQDSEGQEYKVLVAHLEGCGHARWNSLLQAGSYTLTNDMERMDFRLSRSDYPVISGAGWMPSGGYTEFRSAMDIPVTLYGQDLQDGREISMSANLGGLVSQEQAHTVEHAIIRALRTYGLCTARTLMASMTKEMDELKHSLDFSIRHTRPEALGLTATGACGNAMTNLAQTYLADDVMANLAAGRSLDEAMRKARQTTMSQLTQDLGLTMQSGIRVLQGLKKGMSHDDTPLKPEICRKIIRQFPLEPWK